MKKIHTINQVAYCISLKDNYRRKSIQQCFPNVVFFDAIDTRQYKWLQYKSLLTEKSLQQLDTSIATGKRNHHFELVPGAVGCFLSHIRLYQQLLETKLFSKEKLFLILEDDAKPNKWFSSYLSKVKSQFPTDCDLFLFNYHIEEGSLLPIQMNNYDCFRISRDGYFWMMNAYIISVDGIRKILNVFDKIEMQIDAWISLLHRNHSINLYCSDKLYCPQNSAFSITMQFYPVKR